MDGKTTHAVTAEDRVAKLAAERIEYLTGLGEQQRLLIERLERQLKAARSRSRRHEGSGDAITAEAIDHLILAFRKSGWIVDFDPHQITAQAPDGKVINFAVRGNGKVYGMAMLSAESMGGFTETIDDIDPDSLDGDGGLSEARGL